jgi:hypothetical protein
MHVCPVSITFSLLFLCIFLSILCSNIIERPNRRWEDDIKNGLRGIGCEDCGVYSSALGRNPVAGIEKIFTKVDIPSHAVMITRSLV